MFLQPNYLIFDYDRSLYKGEMLQLFQKIISIKAKFEEKNYFFLIISGVVCAV
jgi:hypothetical protein